MIELWMRIIYSESLSLKRNLIGLCVSVGVFEPKEEFGGICVCVFEPKEEFGGICVCVCV